MPDTKERPSLFMLVGLPCTGKTTYLRRKTLKEFDDAVILSTDEHLISRMKERNISYSESFANFYGEACSVLEQNLRDAVKNDKTIIWDQTNISAKGRAKKLKKIPGHYYKVAVVSPETNVDLLMDRQVACRPEQVVPRSAMESFALNFDMPTESEGFDKVSVVDPI